MKNIDPFIPEVVFESGWLLDSTLSDLSKTEANQAAVEEIAERVAEFQMAWSESGTPLLRSALKESGLSFKEKDIKGFLICGPIHSQSHPLILNVKLFLKSMETEPKPFSVFVEIVFHELLHILLQDNVRAFPTPVLQNYLDDGFDVLAHLHLMAMQRNAHEALGNRTEWLAAWYGKMDAAYAKSWDIVSDDHVYGKLIDEINTQFGNP